ncbi:nuclear transport factor 2 family protein [Zoogloea sp.]|uniref:YybH family protein n=1 Tax=Zoogloea sp. TaxID=49181 RepID=UPI00261CA4FA|nr:nuclear transport factor 2 family protein [Zoogloea sp.]MDD3354428.1 nuclear transport factor 2 family protein [Zoogloea sp.]
MSTSDFATPDDAEAAFYAALARADVGGVMAIWSEEEEVVCVHPASIRLVGLYAIRESWRQVFASGARITVSTTHPVRWVSATTAVHSVHQHVHVEGDDRLHPLIIATNVFSRGARGWRLVMHHAAPAPDTDNLHYHDTPHIVH